MEAADRWRIWGYAGLDLSDVPYVLLVLADFAPATVQADGDGRPKRKFWLQCLYEVGFLHIEDFWIRPAVPPRLFRVSYDPPARGASPNSRHLRRSTEIPIDTAFALPGAAIAPLPDWLVDAI